MVQTKLIVLTKTYSTDMYSWYGQGIMVQTRTHGIDMDSLYQQRLMICTQTYGIDNTHGIDLNSCYGIGIPDSHTYERVECCTNVGIFWNKNSFCLVETESYVAICLYLIGSIPILGALVSYTTFFWLFTPVKMLIYLTQ